MRWISKEDRAAVRALDSAIRSGAHRSTPNRPGAAIEALPLEQRQRLARLTSDMVSHRIAGDEPAHTAATAEVRVDGRPSWTTRAQWRARKADR